MNCVLHVMLTFEIKPSFPDIKVDLCFYFMPFADHMKLHHLFLFYSILSHNLGRSSGHHR